MRPYWQHVVVPPVGVTLPLAVDFVETVQAVSSPFVDQSPFIEFVSPLAASPHFAHEVVISHLAPVHPLAS